MPQTVDRFLKRFQVGGYSLHDEQCAGHPEDPSEPGLLYLQDGAGVGKTSTTKAICDFRIWTTYLLCTIAGKAALKLSPSTGSLAMTVARLLAQLRERERIMEQLADPDLGSKRRDNLADVHAGARGLDSGNAGCRG